jgi:hypothetical protein
VEAGRRVTEAMDSDIAARQATVRAVPPTPEEIARNQTAGNLIATGRAGDDLRNMDVGGENIRALARSAANNSPEARDILHRSIDRRYTEQSGRTVDFLRSLIPSQGNAGATRDMLRQAARQHRAPLYRAAYQSGDRGLWTPTLERLAGSPVVRKAMQDASVRGQDRAISEGFGAFNPGVTFENGVMRFPPGPKGTPTYPNLQYWDYVKRELDDAARAAQRRGENDASAVYTTLTRQLRDELDTLVPEYSQARGTAAAFFRAEDALEAGENFVTGQVPMQEARRIMTGMSAPEREAFREGFVSRYIQRLEETGDRRNILGRIAESPAARERIEIALGPNRARELEAFLHIEQIMDLPRTAMGNSTTARQLMELGLAGGAGMLASGGNITDPRAWIVGALTYGARRGQLAADQNMARRIAEMLVAGDEAAFRNAVQQVAYGPGLTAIRNVSAALARGARTSGAGAVAGSGMAQGATAQPSAQPQQFAAMNALANVDDEIRVSEEDELANTLGGVDALNPGYVPGNRLSTNVEDRRNEPKPKLDLQGVLKALLLREAR